MKLKTRLANWMYHNLSGNPERGENDVPGDWLHLEFGELDDHKPMFVANTSNDGSELWIAYNGGEWLFHCRHEHARQLARWILWDWWVKATWCGLKRKLWYWGLHEHLMAQDWYRERYGS